MKLLCESVCFSYSGKQWIFEDYNRVFTSGITILKGYSGCGKTTLLKILAGYLSPQRGRVITPRRKVQADSLYRRKEVSYMFQGAQSPSPRYGGEKPSIVRGNGHAA